MTSCRNCDSPTDDYGECWHCEDARQELLERLREDEAESLAVVTGWVMFDYQEQPERVWRVG